MYTGDQVNSIRKNKPLSQMVAELRTGTDHIDKSGRYLQCRAFLRINLSSFCYYSDLSFAHNLSTFRTNSPYVNMN